MLTELRIHNFAIIDQLDLRFGPGLIILTGETGAGKSIILDAVVMLIGGKADTTFVRTDSDAAFVEGVFQLKGAEKEAVHAILQREDLMDDPDYVVLMREVRKGSAPPAILLANDLNSHLLREALAMHVFSVLSKPVDFNVLLDSLARVLKRYHASRWPGEPQ